MSRPFSAARSRSSKRRSSWSRAHAFFENPDLRQAMADGGVDLHSPQLTFAEQV